MERKLRFFASIGFLTLLVLQFNNCDVYSNQSVFEQNEVAQGCLDKDGFSCFEADDDLLEIRINTENDMKVADLGAGKITKFNVSGDCNEGSYAINRITWVAYRGGKLENFNSTTRGLDGKCDNGRFTLLVELENGFQGSEVKIEVEITTVDDDGVVHKNPFDSLGKSSIFVQPI